MCYHRVSLAGYGFGDGDNLLLMTHRRLIVDAHHCWFIVDAPLGLLIQHHAAHICSAEAERSSGAQTLSSPARRARRSSSAATISLRARYQLATSTLSAHYELANSSLSARSRYRTQRNSYYDRAMLCRPHVVHVQLIVSLL